MKIEDQKSSAVIGSTGFVGKNIVKKYPHIKQYNTKNINSLKGCTYKTVFCAAPSGEKWKVNKNPKDDLKNIKNLYEIICSVNVKNFILISTIDTLTHKKNLSYGGNRLFFEKILKDKLGEKCKIVRVPGIFGPYMKKNIIYDLLNGVTDYVDLNTSYQWLHIDRLISNLCTSSFEILEMYTEPIPTRTLVETFFPNLILDCKSTKKAYCYDIKPSNRKHYYMNKIDVMKDIELFIQQRKNN